RPPRYAHVPLVVANDGSRLEKRTAGGILRALREAGIGASRVVGELAHGLGLLPTSAPTSAVDVAQACDRREIAWRRRPWRIPTSLLPQ
ncbi:MAG: hypothetical protein M3O46_03025, partial [Myxococcota bacterium]|nr:hypothetical protein [Myxococcota bacterium]